VLVVDEAPEGCLPSSEEHLLAVEVPWWQEKQDEVIDWSRCRVAAHDRILHAGFAEIHHKIVGLLG
jgi:hypothetical protein